MTPLLQEQLENIRRIAERGRHYGLLDYNTHVVDLFQHILDELERIDGRIV